MSKRKKVIITVCCLVAVSAAGLGVYRAMNQSAAPVVAAVPSQAIVRAEKPSVGDIAHAAEFIGTVEPNEVVTVVPKLAGGTVLKTYFEVGDTVKKGDLLFEIDSEDIQLALNAAEAELEAGRIKAEVGLGSGYDAQIIQAKSALDAAQRGYNTARANLKSYDDKMGGSMRMLEKAMTSLETKYKAAQDAYDAAVNSGTATSDDLKDLRETMEAAEIAYEAARANYIEADNNDDAEHRGLRTMFTNAQISYNAAKDAYDLLLGQGRDDTELTTEAGLRAAEVGMDAQRKQLEYTMVRSPIDGVIEQKAVAEHQLFGGSSPAYYTVSNKSMMLVRFAVSESAIMNIEIGDKVELEKSGQYFDGTVTEVATMADPASGLFTVKAAVDSADIPLHTGSTVKIVAQTEKSDEAILVPLDSVYYDDGAAYVYCYRDGTAVRTAVETGISNQQEIEIVSGLSPEDQVIVTWHPRLLDGVSVVLEGDTPAATPVDPPASQPAQ